MTSDVQAAVERVLPTVLKVGQKLYWVGSRRHGTEEVTVLKVGRRWATLSNGERVCLKTLWADGGIYASPGRAYLSREAYDEERRRDRLWQDFRNAVSGKYGPGDTSSEQILQAAALLGIELKEQP